MKRPTAVTVFGILNIVFAALGLLTVFGAVLLFALVGMGFKNPIVQIIHDNPAYALWLEFSIALGLLAALLLLAAGIGLLKLKPWARMASIGYAIYAMVMVVIGTMVNFFLLTRPMLEQAQPNHGPAAVAAIGGAIGGMAGGCFGLVYPVLLLIFMLRKDVAAAFVPADRQS